jgi:hypothetical protein
MIISRKGDPVAALSPDDNAFSRRLGSSILRIANAAARDAPGSVVDLENRYWQLLDEYGCEVIVTRPYIFGVCPSVMELLRPITQHNRCRLKGNSDGRAPARAAE